MEPFDITWPGSRDRITVSSIAREYELIDSAAEFLASRLGEYWSPKRHVAGGPFLSVDQRGAWRARIGDAFIAGCVVLVARHTSSNDGVVAVAIAERVPDKQVSQLVIQSKGGYEAQTVDEVMFKALHLECQKSGYPLAKPRIEWDLL